MEIRVLDAVPVDLADVEVGGDFGDVVRWDAVGGAVDGEGWEGGFLCGRWRWMRGILMLFSWIGGMGRGRERRGERTGFTRVS